MNQTQLQTTLAPIITFIAGILAGRNVFGWDLGTWSTVIGGAVAFVGTIWAAIVTRKTAIVSTVATLPEVNKVELVASAPGTAALNAATPNNVVVK